MYLRHASLLLASTLLLSAGCGKKGPLLYPDMLIAQPPRQASVEQTGAALRVSFDLPSKDRSGRTLKDLEAVRIARRICRDRSCKGCLEAFVELQRIDPGITAPAERQGDRISWVDTGVRDGETVQYRLQTQQQGGVIGSTVTTRPIQLLAPPVAPLLTAHSAFGGIVLVELQGTQLNSTKAVLDGYVIYRATDDNAFQKLAQLPAGTTRYEDQAVQIGTRYRYVARTLVRRDDGNIAESSQSNAVVVTVGEDAK